MLAQHSVRHMQIRNAVVVGSGPSLSVTDIDLIFQTKCMIGDEWLTIIAVNDAYRVTAGDTDILYACDYPWWRYHCQMYDRTGVPGILFICPEAKRYSGEPMAVSEFGCELVQMRAGRGIAPIGSDYVMRGYGSGFQAVGLAIKLGARRIALLGMDCKRADDGRSHFFGEHPPELPNPQPFQTWVEDFDSLAAPATELGIEIVNCSRDSAITELEKMDLGKWLARLCSS